MNKNIRALVEACDELAIKYEIASKTGNLINLLINHKNYLFINWSTPLDNVSGSQLCQDKAYFYEFFNAIISIPTTAVILDPDCNKNYHHYLIDNNLKSMISTIETSLNYPLIVKPNKGCGGQGVFKVTRQEEFIQAVTVIFNKNHRVYDYIALAQQYIMAQHEYRAIFVNSTLVFAYEKNCLNADYKENLSPLHWEGSKAELVTDQTILDTLQLFSNPLFDKLAIPYCGLDILVDSQQNYWLIEANSSPSYDFFIRDNGVSELKKMYLIIIRSLINGYDLKA
ncbi:MAG: ATP-grasp domain-containing protein [Methylococcales bacterium]|nr:ATP-grasp domain-containing protein [Methylococcales bacterium]